MAGRQALVLSACLLAASANRAMADDRALATDINQRIIRCWNVPADLPDHVGPVRVRMSLTRSGELAASPAIEGMPAGDAASKIFAASAIRAIVRCAPYAGLEALAPYEKWKTAVITFKRPE
jgi:hypothetical protein